jgi:ATP-dependent helicase/nuclease subunit B
LASNKNLFAPTNPAHTADALWHIISTSGVALSDILIFLPSRRAVRSVEQMLVQKYGHAIILPHMVALGEGVDEAEEYEPATEDTVSNTERVVILAKLLSEDKNIGNIATALPVARDLVRMTDYLENEGIDVATINWSELVDENFAEHFQKKAKILNILSAAMPQITAHRLTTTAKRMPIFVNGFRSCNPQIADIN